MRRPTTVEVMLLSAIGLWALNLTITRYILTHGFQPLAYATVRYALAAAVFLGITIAAERSLRVARRDPSPPFAGGGRVRRAIIRRASAPSRVRSRRPPPSPDRD